MCIRDSPATYLCYKSNRKRYAAEGAAKAAGSCENRYHYALRHGEPEQCEGFSQEVFGMKLGNIISLVRGNTYKSALLSETEGARPFRLGKHPT